MFRSLLASLLLLVAAPALADSVRIDAGSALTAVVKHFGWLEAAGVPVLWTPAGEAADFAVTDGGQAIAARAANRQVKAIYVLSRAAASDAAATDATEYLLVSESTLAQRGAEARVVLATLERARHWIIADPAAAESLIGAAARDRNFSGSRPGPAQLASLKKIAHANGLDQQLGAALLDDSAYRAALTQPRADQIAAVSR